MAHPDACICALCGGPTSMLDWAFGWPDCVFAQPEAERSPRNSADFAELGDRRFVRGLLPVRLQSGDEFRFGVWLEVDADTFTQVLDSWNDDDRYGRLRFQARIANAVPPWHEEILGARVDVDTRDAGSRPFVASARFRWLQRVLDRGWTDAEYQGVVADFVGN